MGRKRLNKREKPKVNPELDGFDIKIDTFGEIQTNYDIDKINKFLNKHVDDKKLRDRDDIEGRDEAPNQKDDDSSEEE
ncbi:hypothetical protein [Tunicatimonas pelagia]|uniref:hypothetical protein n=1 Tax=Tunicatimonas pelagia TaxID=931531 RepID=UPI0026657717|nr:hypothetical protein [Tunicatimonas pelagia]WKN45897.1 hypothetical protein P0M28_13105 [Tunicatimonas pelagia]